MSIEQDINEFLLDPAHKDRLMHAALGALEDQIKAQFQWRLPDVIAKECNDFLAEHVVPEIRAHLIARKGVIIEAAKNAADDLGKSIASQIVSKAAKNMETNYKSSAVMKALFD